MIVLWGIICSYGLIIFAAIIMLGVVFWQFSSNQGGSSPGPMPTAIGFAGLLMCPVLIGLVTFFIWWIVLMCLYRNRFTHVFNAASAR